LLVFGGFILAWFTPYAARGVSMAWGAMLGGEEGPVEEPGLPESPDDKPPFAIPPGVVGYLPFGPRLERDDFLLRREQDGITLLLREAKSGMGPGTDPLIRGECYDYLTAEGRWIRSRRRERVVRDEADGTKDECLTLGGATAQSTGFVECLIPSGPDRTLYVLTAPTKLWLPKIVMDGTGNLLDAGGRSPLSSYVVEATAPWGRPGSAVVADPGPEFLLLPEDLDREKLAAIVEPLMEFAEDDFERIEVIRQFLLRRFLNLPDDAPERAEVEVSLPPPDRLDVAGFLLTRRWGSSIDFATAHAMLLRSVGIPCRLATGYRQGNWLTDAEFYVFRANHLHAWVEVPFEGFGWFPFNSTPKEPDLTDDELGQVLLRPPEERGDAAAELEVEEGDRSLVGRLLDAIDGWISSLLPGERSSTTSGRVVAWIVLLGAALMVLRALLAASDRGRRALTTRLDHAHGVIRALFYERLVRILAKRGIRRRPTETPLEFARTVTSARGAEYAEVRRLTNAFCAARYGGRVIGRSKQDELFERAVSFGDLLEKRDRERRLRLEQGRETTRRRFWPFGVLLLAVILSLGSAALAATPRELVEALGDVDVDARLEARGELALLGKRAIPVLIQALAPRALADRREQARRLVLELDADDFEIRNRATRILKEMGPVARPAVEQAVSFESPEVERRARDILRYMDGAGKTVYAVAAAARERRRDEVLLLLGVVGDARAVDAVLQAGLTWPALQRRAVSALARLARRHPDRFYIMIDGSDPLARMWALRALASARPPGLKARFALLVESPDPEIRRLVRAALVTADVVEETDRARLWLRRAMRVKARAALYRVLKDCPGYVEATWILVGMLEEDGDFRAALEVLDGVSDPDLEVLLRKVELLHRADQVDEALEVVMALVGEYPKDYRTHLLAARTYLQRNPPDPRLALARAEHAVALAPDIAETWALAGRILGEHLDDPTGARDALRRALMLDSENESFRTELKKYLGR